MKIELMRIEDLVEYENNAKEHPQEQIDQIAASIKEFGNNDPIAVDENNVIIEGHGRLYALKQLGYEEVPVIKLSHMTEDQKKAYILAHNKLTMNTGFDFDKLQKELDKLDEEFQELAGFTDEEISEIFEELGSSTKTEVDYTDKIDIPHYEIKGDKPEIDEMIDMTKTNELLEDIEKSNIPEDIKEFLRLAAQRHLVFTYSKIAEFYAHADKETQELMENSALVIIDIDNAYKNGYVKLTKAIKQAEFSEDEGEV